MSVQPAVYGASFTWTLADPAIEKARELVNNLPLNTRNFEKDECVAKLMRIVAVADIGTAREIAKGNHSYVVWRTLLDLELQGNNIANAVQMFNQDPPVGKRVIQPDAYRQLVQAQVKNRDYSGAKETTLKIVHLTDRFLAILDIAEGDKGGDYSYLVHSLHGRLEKPAKCHARCARLFSHDFTEAKKYSSGGPMPLDIFRDVILEQAKYNLDAAVQTYRSVHTCGADRLLKKLVPIAAVTNPQIACELARDASTKELQILLLIEVVKIAPSSDLLAQIEQMTQAMKPGSRLYVLSKLFTIEGYNKQDLLEEEIAILEKSTHLSPKIQCLYWIEAARASARYLPKARQIVISHNDLDLLNLLVTGCDRSGSYIIR